MADSARTRKRGPTQADGELIVKWCRAACYAAGVRGAELDDVAQDAALKVWQRRRVFSRARGQITTWIWMIATRKAVEKLRQRRRRLAKEQSLPAGAEQMALIPFRKTRARAR